MHKICHFLQSFRLRVLFFQNFLAVILVVFVWLKVVNSKNFEPKSEIYYRQKVTKSQFSIAIRNFLSIVYDIWAL